MTTREDYGNAYVCTDCYFAHHYGYEPCGDGFVIGPDRDPDKDYVDCEPLALLKDFELFDNTDSDSGEGIRTYSSRYCEGCGNTFGGTRHRLSLWKVAP